MKKIFYLAASVGIATLVSTQAKADLLTKDLYSEGDGLITFDTETGLEWMDFSQTLGKTIEDIEPLLDQEFEGFEIAYHSQVVDMVEKVMPSVFTSDTFYLGRDGSTERAKTPRVNESESAIFRQFFRNSSADAYGMFYHNNENLEGYNAGVLGVNDWNNGKYAYYDLRFFSSDHATDRNGDGTNSASVYLVSEGGFSYSSLNDSDVKLIQEEKFGKASDVSSSFGLAGLGLTFLLGLRKRKVS